MMAADKSAARDSPPGRGGLPAPRPRRPRLELPRLPRTRLVPELSAAVVDASVRLWFDEEAEALQRLAHTQRLKGDFVAAQTLEREIRVLIADMHALLQTPVTGEL